MGRIIVHPGGIRGSVEAPPSKSYTHRAILIALLAEGRSKLSNPLYSGDTWASINTAKALGGMLEAGDALTVEGLLPLKAPENVIDVENSGTTMRITSALAAHVEEGYTVLTGDESLRRRPMKPLLSALKGLGVMCWSTRLNGRPPIVVKGGGISGGSVEIRGDVSSQFISGLLIAAPRAERDISIKILGPLVSKPYVDMTLETLFEASVDVENESYKRFLVRAPQDVKPFRFQVPGDMGLSAFLFALASITNSTATVRGFDFSRPQSDLEVLSLIEEMGCEVKVDKRSGSVTVSGGELIGGEFRLRDAPDLLPVVAALATRAEGKTVIKDVGHARFKESDRIACLARELPKLGVQVRELEDGLEVEGSKRLKGCFLKSYGDHRLFMALFAAAAAASEPCEIDGLESVFISYPNFIEDVKRLGIRVEAVEE